MSGTAQRKPLALDRGATFDEVFYWSAPDPDDPTIDLPIAMGDYRARMVFYLDPAAPLLTLTSEDEGGLIIEPGGEMGALYVRAQSVATSLLYRTCMYELTLISLADEDDRVDLAYGPVRVNPGPDPRVLP